MRRTVLILLFLGALMVIGAGVVLAQGGAESAANSSDFLLLTAGFSMAVAAAGCGYAQSKALAAACEGVSRNPGATDTIRVFIFIGLAFIEFLALLTFVVVLIIYIGK